MMEKKVVEALLTLSGIEYQSIWEIANQYVPVNEHYAVYRQNNPWWLIFTDRGPIIIGRRKRVFSISWQDTDIRFVVTTDDVTKDQTMVHAWSLPKALEYLIALQCYIDQMKRNEECQMNSL